MKISTKIFFVSLGISSFILMTVLFFAYNNGKKIQTRQILSQLQSIASHQSSRIEEIVDQKLAGLKLVASRTQLRLNLADHYNDDQQSRLEKVDRILADASSSIKEFRKISVIGPEGDVIASSDTGSIGRRYPGKQIFLQGQNEFVAYFLHLENEDRKVMLHLAGPLVLEDKLLGVLVIESSLEPLISVITDSTGLGEAGETVLTVKDKESGEIFIMSAGFDPDTPLSRKVFKDTGYQAGQELSGEKTGLTEKVDYRGVPVLAVSHYLDDIGLGITVKKDRQEAYAPIREQRHFLIALLAGACLLAGFLSFYLAGILTRQIRLVTEAAKALSEGDPGIRVREISTDEAGTLARAFNKMADHLTAYIEEQEKSVRALQAKEKRFRALLDQATDAIFVCDMKGRIIDINKAACNSLGYSRKELLQMNVADVDPDFLRENHPAEVWGKLDLDSTINIESLHQRRDGTTFPVEIHVGQVELEGQQTILGVARDISERKRREAERLRLATAVEQGADCIVITDREGVIEYVNPSFERATGYKKEEVVGTSFGILKGGGYAASFSNREIWDTLLKGHSWRGRLTSQKKDGTPFEEEVSITPVLSRFGEISSYVAVKRNISDQASLEQQLRQSQKMEAIGTLAGGIAHDFNNILSAILGYAELGRMDTAPDSKLRRDLNEIVKAGHRARDLVNQILTFSRKSGRDLSPLNIHLILKEALKLLRSSIPSTIEIREDIDPDCGTVLGDPTQLQQVIMNLCTNAYQAMRESGGVMGVRLYCGETEGEEAELKEGLEPGSYVVLEVKDTGPGMSPDILERIFEPYFTTKKKGEGTGMGLSVVHGIVKSHDGNITVDSSPGRGAVFRVYLPLYEESPSYDAGDVEPGTPLPSGTERILVVDDEENVVRIMERILTGLGYQVHAVTSSEEALRIFEEKPEQFDLVVTDMTMPHIMGTDLADRMLAIRSDMPIILCTGYNELISREEALSLGIREFAMKPVSEKELADLVRRVLDQKNGKGGIPGSPG
ncbi:MAG: PAS domain S-box protein [Desulfurivibrionaceae bacterium]